MKNKKIFIILLSFMFILPIHVKADTWLDDPSYRDTSWFDSSTYDSTTLFLIDSPAKMAGLLYLVNVENYTFENKTIKIIGSILHKACDTCSYIQTLDLREHDWVPLNSGFKGTFFSQSLDHRILTKTISKKMYLTENQSCDFITNLNSSPYNDPDCGWIYYNERYYPIEIETNGNGSIEVDPVFLSGMTNTITVLPDNGYYLNNLIITKKSNNSNVRVYRFGTNQYAYYGPFDDIIINADFEKIGEVSCKYIKGNGENIGDEIACGTEHFYVLSKTNNQIRMLSKYNLNTGVSIFKVPAEEGKTCSDIAKENGGTNKSDAFYTAEGYCFYYKYLPTIDIMQNEDAKSAHWDSDLNYLYPQVGDTYMVPGDNALYYEPINKRQIGNTDFYDFDLDLEANLSVIMNTSKEGIRRSLYQYKDRLGKMSGVNIQNLELLSITELNNILNQISGSTIPLKEWGDEVKATFAGTTYNIDVTFGNLKPYIPQEYKWLYSTTYWNSTLFNDSSTYYNEYFVFVAEQGKLCGAGFKNCAPTTTLGCGLRPVVTLSSDDIKYSINTEESTHGTIEVVDAADANEQITFNVIPEFGYTVDKIVITTESGEKLTFSQDDIIYNEGGTISISKNKFTMPDESVTISAVWRLDLDLINPLTGNVALKLLLFILSITIIWFIVTVNRKRTLKKNI